ncbi:MAG: hypothetical protein KAS32_24815 [Candidatus Peribacteraceae bacterium]|nr:hypothetical protein [Candidatus Peribacteraceae bacterium]
MSKVTINIEIRTNNAAFDGNPQYEVDRLVQEAIGEPGYLNKSDKSLIDRNGNNVGFIGIKWEDD